MHILVVRRGSLLSRIYRAFLPIDYRNLLKLGDQFKDITLRNVKREGNKMKIIRLDLDISNTHRTTRVDNY